MLGVEGVGSDSPTALPVVTWNPCYWPGEHAHESAVAEHLDCLAARIFYSLNGVIDEAIGMATLARRRHEPDLVIEAEIIRLDVEARMGDFEAAKPALLELLRQVPLGSALSSRIKAHIGSVCDRLGQRAEAGRWMREALAGWPAGERPDWRAEALMITALIGMSRTNVDYALVHHAVAEVTAHGSAYLLASTLANFAEVSAECGDLAVSTQFADAAVALLRRHPELTAVLTLDSIARSRLAVGELTAAEYCLVDALQLEPELHCTDVQGDPWLTYAEVKLALGEPAQAWDLLEHPRRADWAAKCSWMESRDLKLRAQILAAQGRWQQAYESLVQHLDAYEGLRSVEGDRALAEFNSVQLAEEERRRAAEFERLALTDPLTALPNRRQVERWLSSQTAPSVALAIIDLDHFKRINDNYSHDSGDEVLRRVARVLAAVADAEPGLLVGRLGGEEFIALAVGDDVALTRARANRLLDAIRALDLDDIDLGLRITASIGIAFADPAETSVLLRAADQCLYAAKRDGRDRIVIAS